MIIRHAPRTAIAPRAIAVAALLATAAIATPTHAYFAGDGKDAAKGNDCLIGYEGTVSFAPPPGLDVAGLTLLMNYPEERVFMPPAGAQTQIGAANFAPLYPPAEVLIRGADLTHAVRGLVADSAVVPPGPIFQLTFQDCEGADAPTAGEFNCVVLDATDPFTTPVSGVTCGVTLP